MSKQLLGRDNWLHILSNAIANYAEEGGEVQVTISEGHNGVVIYLEKTTPQDDRLHPDFVRLLDLQHDAG